MRLLKTIGAITALMLLPYIIDLTLHRQPLPEGAFQWQHIDGEASWSIQGQDDALTGCPTRYHEWVDLPDGGRTLIGCWGDTHEP